VILSLLPWDFSKSIKEWLPSLCLSVSFCVMCLLSLSTI